MEIKKITVEVYECPHCKKRFFEEASYAKCYAACNKVNQKGINKIENLEKCKRAISGLSKASTMAEVVDFFLAGLNKEFPGSRLTIVPNTTASSARLQDGFLIIPIRCTGYGTYVGFDFNEASYDDYRKQHSSGCVINLCKFPELPEFRVISSEFGSEPKFLRVSLDFLPNIAAQVENIKALREEIDSVLNEVTLEFNEKIQGDMSLALLEASIHAQRTVMAETQRRLDELSQKIKTHRKVEYDYLRSRYNEKVVSVNTTIQSSCKEPILQTLVGRHRPIGF